MDVVQWEQKYETGIEDIDLQHHYFLNLVNYIIEALETKREKAYIEALISELNAYAKFHFKSEERMMVHSKYPDYETHKKHHLDLIERLSVEQYKLLNAMHSDEAAKVIDFLIHWFLDHTAGEDRLFANYLHAQRQQQG